VLTSGAACPGEGVGGVSGYFRLQGFHGAAECSQGAAGGRPVTMVAIRARW
jgi:hypothetical protein